MANLTVVGTPAQENVAPVGVLESGETVGLKPQDKNGLMLVLGRSGTGKTIFLETVVASDIVNGRGGLLIDPHGDIVDDLMPYVPERMKDKVAVFEAKKGDAKSNIEYFKSRFDLTEMQKDSGKVLLCKLKYGVVGDRVAREVGEFILKQFFRLVPSGGSLGSRFICVDESHNFIDPVLFDKVLGIRQMGGSCILSDQQLNNLSAANAQRLFSALDHFICYAIHHSREGRMAVDGLQLGIAPDALTDVERYHFYGMLTVSGQRQKVFRARGVFPVPYPKHA